MGSAVVLGLSIAGSLFTFLYQGLIWRENKKRDKAEGGPPASDFVAETNVYADDAQDSDTCRDRAYQMILIVLQLCHCGQCPGICLWVKVQ